MSTDAQESLRIPLAGGRRCAAPACHRARGAYLQPHSWCRHVDHATYRHVDYFNFLRGSHRLFSVTPCRESPHGAPPVAPCDDTRGRGACWERPPRFTGGHRPRRGGLLTPPAGAAGAVAPGKQCPCGKAVADGGPALQRGGRRGRHPQTVKKWSGSGPLPMLAIPRPPRRPRSAEEPASLARGARRAPNNTAHHSQCSGLSGR